MNNVYIIYGQEWRCRIDEYLFIHNACFININGVKYIYQNGILYNHIVFAKTMI